MPGHRFLVWLHRYCGLVMAAFLAVVGLTGSLLAFNFELERVFAPHLFAKAQPGVKLLDLSVLAERAAAIVPHGRPQIIAYTYTDQVRVDFIPELNPATGKPYDLGFDKFYIDPWTGKELGRRRRGDLSQGIANVMPFIYELHWTLAAGVAGQWILGSVAVIWTLDCFVGFYLTLPRGRGGFLRRWKYAWSVKWSANAFRINFDIHRASGLWLWVLLFIFAWSSVMMNIRPAYEKVMSALFDYKPPFDSFLSQGRANPAPALDWRAAEVVGRRLIEEQSRARGFRAGQVLGLVYFPETGAYIYEVRGSRDLFERAPKGGGTAVVFDGDRGGLREFSEPTGEHTGNTIESWLYALHMARVFGRPYQILVSLLGLVVASLSVTGVYIWWRKLQVRSLTETRRA